MSLLDTLAAGTPTKPVPKAMTLKAASTGIAVLDMAARAEEPGTGGGGYGDPLDREPEAVLPDVISGIISEEVARDIYGVAIKNPEMTLDVSATQELRASLREQR